MSVTIAVPREKCEIFCPEREQILGINQNWKCPDCFNFFKCQSNLTLHLIKVHKKSDVSLASKGNGEQRYFCPQEKCIYNIESDEKHYFAGFKQLKQHFIKVHKEKSFECKNCAKAFPDECSLKRHEKSCGFKFYCICGSSYRNQPSLVYHIKQKGHAFEWSDFDMEWEQFGAKDDDLLNLKKKGRKRNQAIQTETRQTKKRSISQTTQTSSRTSNTNTNNTNNKKKKVSTASVDSVQEVAASTQTLPSDDKSFVLNDLFLLNYTDNCSQTLPNSNNIETQTERDVFLPAAAQDSQDSTDFLLFNHMQTQTTEEDLFVPFNDIETQTHWDLDFDFHDLVSTETQTPRIQFNNESASTHTQTAGNTFLDYTSSHTQT